MIQQEDSASRWAWGLVWIWTAVIFTMVPLARRVQAFVAGHWGRDVFLAIAAACVVIGATATLCALRRRGGLQPRSISWLVAVALCYLAFTYWLRRVPEEALHFVEYGVLGALAFRAFRARTDGFSTYLCAALLCALVGTMDEVMQWAVPGRIFDFRDVRLNTLSGGLMQVAIGMGLRPASRPPRRKFWGKRVGCRLLMAELMLLGLCYSNTPDRVEAYVSRVPALRGLSRNPSVMNEFGYRHRIEGVGVFNSRFTLEELVSRDRARAEGAAAILDAYWKPASYSAFLDTYTPGVDPFVHEARVHLFSRDEHIRFARMKPSGSHSFREHLSVAYRENLFLERYFGETVRRSRFRQSAAKNEELARWNLPDYDYVSRVGANMVTRYSERQLWVAILLSVAVLVAIDWGYGKRVRAETRVGRTQ